MIRQNFCILQLFSGKFEVGGGVCVLVSVMFWEDFFAFSMGKSRYFQSAQVTSAARNLCRLQTH